MRRILEIDLIKTIQKWKQEIQNMLATSFLFLFLMILGLAVFLEKLPKIVFIIYSAMSVITFISYGLDKSAAKKDRWRTPEKTLQLLGLFGGWPGALAAQKIFRHKSRKTSFQVLFWISVIINCSAIALFYLKKNHLF